MKCQNTKIMENTKIFELLKSRLFDFTQLPPKEHKIITIDDNTILSRSNFMLLSGAPKVGKSLFSSIIIAAALSDLKFYRIKVKQYEDKPRIAIFDTEQGANDLYNSINRSFELIERETNFSKKDLYYKLKSKIDVFTMRQDDPAPILQMLECFIQNNTTTGIVIIDGLLDLVYNYNDEKETKILINFLKRITQQYNVGIICVLHTGKTTGTTIGHIGSFADRYCQSNLEITKENDNVVLKAKLLRSAKDFDPICLNRNGSYIYEVDYIEETPKRR